MEKHALFRSRSGRIVYAQMYPRLTRDRLCRLFPRLRNIIQVPLLCLFYIQNADGFPNVPVYITIRRTSLRSPLVGRFASLTVPGARNCEIPVRHKERKQPHTPVISTHNTTQL
jgi:hypothetical protein